MKSSSLSEDLRLRLLGIGVVSMKSLDMIKSMTPGQAQISNAIRELVVFMDNVNGLSTQVTDKHDYTEAQRIVHQDLTQKIDDLHQRGVLTTGTWNKVEGYLDSINHELKISAGPDIGTLVTNIESLEESVWQDMADDVADYVRSPKAVGTKRKVVD